MLTRAAAKRAAAQAELKAAALVGTSAGSKKEGGAGMKAVDAAVVTEPLDSGPSRARKPKAAPHAPSAAKSRSSVVYGIVTDGAGNLVLQHTTATLDDADDGSAPEQKPTVRDPQPEDPKAEGETGGKRKGRGGKSKPVRLTVTTKTFAVLPGTTDAKPAADGSKPDAAAVTVGEGLAGGADPVVQQDHTAARDDGDAAEPDDGAKSKKKKQQQKSLVVVEDGGHADGPGHDDGGGGGGRSVSQAAARGDAGTSTPQQLAKPSQHQEQKPKKMEAGGKAGLDSSQVQSKQLETPQRQGRVEGGSPTDAAAMKAPVGFQEALEVVKAANAMQEQHVEVRLKEAVAKQQQPEAELVEPAAAVVEGGGVEEGEDGTKVSVSPTVVRFKEVVETIPSAAHPEPPEEVASSLSDSGAEPKLRPVKGEVGLVFESDDEEDSSLTLPAQKDAADASASQPTEQSRREEEVRAKVEEARRRSREAEALEAAADKAVAKEAGGSSDLQAVQPAAEGSGDAKVDHEAAVKANREAELRRKAEEARRRSREAAEHAAALLRELEEEEAANQAKQSKKAEKRRREKERQRQQKQQEAEARARAAAEEEEKRRRAKEERRRQQRQQEQEKARRKAQQQQQQQQPGGCGESPQQAEAAGAGAAAAGGGGGEARRRASLQRAAEFMEAQRQQQQHAPHPGLPDEIEELEGEGVEHDDLLPDHLLCPISLLPLTDPVVAADGNTYQRHAIQAWFHTCGKGQREVTSPLTGLPMPADLKPNHLVRYLVLDSLAKAATTVKHSSSGGGI